jgi:hypothetical protein
MLLVMPHVPAVAGRSEAGSIAYISNERREVRIIAPDGTGDRSLWVAEGPEGFGIEDVAWRPDGRALAIASAHEADCSIWHADLYRLAPADDAQPVRITNGPGCRALGGYPVGTVTVELVNGLFDQSMFVVYVQGAPEAKLVTLQPGLTTTVVFEDVADLGDGALQYASAAVGSSRWLDAAVFADVMAGEVANAGSLLLSSTSYDSHGALTASWNRDGSRLAFQLGQGLLWSIPAEPGPLERGTALFADSGVLISATDPAWSPVNDDIAYQRFDTDPFSIEVAAAGADLPGTPWAYTTLSRGIAWLPDGSGLVVADEAPMLQGWTNLFRVDLGDGNVTQLTSLPAGEHAWWPSVSPDGLRVVYSHITGDPDGPDATVELRILDLASGAVTTIHDAGLQPTWGPADLVTDG